MAIAVEANSLTKQFGQVTALDGVSFHINQGEIFGLIGPNGAGKTTTIRTVCTLIKPTSGSISLFGLDAVKEPEKAREILSYLPEESGAYPNLTGYEYLQFMAKLQAAPGTDIKTVVAEAAEICGLGDRLKDKAKTYSKGMKRRLLVARSLMTKPKLAVLDEPASGLDVMQAYHIREIIKRYVKEQGVTVMLSSHNMLEVESLCNRVAFINKGHLVMEGEPKELKARYKSDNLEEVFAKVVGYA
ncbi:MAG TPA: ABC transporter ATP-binding protein [Oculatellaceae cyanobacterium]